MLGRRVSNGVRCNLKNGVGPIWGLIKCFGCQICALRCIARPRYATCNHQLCKPLLQSCWYCAAILLQRTAMEIYDLDIKILSIDIGHRKDHIVSTINWAAFSLSYFKTTIQTLRCFIVKISTQGGHWLGEDIDWWHFVVKIQRQWDDLIWARHDTQRINEISRLCWRPNTSAQVSFIRHAFTLCRFNILTS